MAQAIGTARPVCVEKLYRIAKGAWDDGDDFGLVDEVVGVACEATYAMRNDVRGEMGGEARKRVSLYGPIAKPVFGQVRVK